MRPRERFSPAQCRAARALLGWSIEDLAREARLEAEGVELYEQLEGRLSTGDLIVLGAALNRGGVIALPEGWAGEGVRLREIRGAGRRTPFVAGSAPAQDDDPFDLLSPFATVHGVAATGRTVARALLGRPHFRVAHGR